MHDDNDDLQDKNNPDESSPAGHMSDPESDDDTLETAHNAGLYREADDEHPTELGIAEEIEKDEKERDLQSE